MINGQEFWTGFNINTLVNIVGLLVLGCFIPAVRAGLLVLNKIRAELQDIRIELAGLIARVEAHGDRLRSLERRG